jgi:hypothetical protein
MGKWVKDKEGRRSKSCGMADDLTRIVLVSSVPERLLLSFAFTPFTHLPIYPFTHLPIYPSTLS